MSEKTPGEVAYEAHMTASGLVPSWGDDEDYHAAWEAAAQAAVTQWFSAHTTPVTPLAAQHTYTAACDGFHEPGQCPRTEAGA